MESENKNEETKKHSLHGQPESHDVGADSVRKLSTHFTQVKVSHENDQVEEHMSKQHKPNKFISELMAHETDPRKYSKLEDELHELDGTNFVERMEAMHASKMDFATPDSGVSGSDGQIPVDTDVEFYMNLQDVSHLGFTRVQNKPSSLLPKQSIPQQDKIPASIDRLADAKPAHGPKHTALKGLLCKAKKMKCRTKEETSDLDDDDVSNFFDPDKPLPVVGPLLDTDPDCNPYCRWLKRQLVLEASGDKLDSIMTMRELGEKYLQVFGKIRCVLINLSGTLTVDNAPTENAIKAVQMLQRFGVKVRYVTNTTQICKRLLLRSLVKLGFPIEAFEIYTALTAAREAIEENSLRPYFLVEESAMEDFAGIKTTNPNAVVVGLSPTNFDYLRFNKALRLVMSGAPIVGIHKARMHKLTNGLLSLGPGPFIDVLEYATSGTSYLVGKPSQAFFRSALASTGCSVNETVIIGDDIAADIEGAVKCGMKGILVQTGKYKENDEFSISSLTPTLVTKNFALAVRCIVGALAVAQGIKTGESDTEDPVAARRQRILKGEVSTNVEFIEKIQAYVNDCGVSVWCHKAEEPHPPRLKRHEYYVQDYVKARRKNKNPGQNNSDEST